MTIHINTLTLHVIIGLLDFEREKQQKVIIDLDASYDYIDKQFIDYADIALLIENDLKSKKYKLLEDAILGVKTQLCITYPKIKTLNLKISKPNILKNCLVSISDSWIVEKQQ